MHVSKPVKKTTLLEAIANSIESAEAVMNRDGAEWKTMQRVTVKVDPDLIDLIPEFLTRKRADLQI